MATTPQERTIVKGYEEVEETYQKRKGWFLIFPTTWWEKVRSDHISNDIVIETTREIGRVYLNGKLIK